MKRIWLSSWFGAVYTIVAVSTAVAYVAVFGAMFGEWGWLQISIALLVLGILVVAAIGALDHQPNPYGRTNPLYNLDDVPEHGKLESAGSGWITQILPMLAAAIALLVISLIL